MRFGVDKIVFPPLPPPQPPGALFRCFFSFELQTCHFFAREKQNIHNPNAIQRPAELVRKYCFAASFSCYLFRHIFLLPQKAVAINPGVAIYHFNLAMVLALQEGIASSLSAFAEAMKLEPNTAKYPFYLANLYFKARKFKKAEKFFRKGAVPMAGLCYSNPIASLASPPKKQLLLVRGWLVLGASAFWQMCMHFACAFCTAFCVCFGDIKFAIFDFFPECFLSPILLSPTDDVSSLLFVIKNVLPDNWDSISC